MKNNLHFTGIKSSIYFHSILLLLIFSLQTISASAVNRVWDGGGADNNWSTPGNWENDIVPTAADDVLLSGNSGKNSTINQNFTVNSLRIEGYTGTLTQGAGVNLTISNFFTQSSGTFQGSDGTFNFSGNSLISGGTFTGGSGQITHSGNSSLTQSGGTFSTAGNVSFYSFSHSNGTFNAPAGTLTINGGLVNNAGVFNANGGTVLFKGIVLSTSGLVFNNLTIDSAGTAQNQTNLTVDGTLSLVDGIVNSNAIIANGDVSYGSTFDGGSVQLQFAGTATRTVNLPANGNLLGMLIDNPNITVATSSTGPTTFPNSIDVKRGIFKQGDAQLNFGPGAAGGGNPYTITISGGTFEGSGAPLVYNNAGNITVTGGAFAGGTGAISAPGINQTGGAFAAGGDVNISSFVLSGGTFNAPNGTLTVAADWTHTTGGTFNGGTGTVKFTGYNTFNCINQIIINVNVTETFNNLNLANSFCNQRYISAGDTLIVNGDLRLSNGGIAGGRIRALGTTTIDPSNSGYAGSTIVEYVTPNTNFVINNPSSVTGMLPVEINAANSTLTSSGTGRINFVGMTLTNGTVNQGAGIWDITNPGYAQSGGIFNGSAAELFISNGAGSPVLSGGTFSSGTGKVTGSFRMTGGTMSIAGDLDAVGFSLEGGTFNAPLGVMSIGQSFSHTLGGTFNARTGTVQTSTAVGTYQAGFDVNSTETFNNLKFNGTNNNANHIIATGDTFIVNGTLAFNGRGVNGGSIVANGSVVYENYGAYQNATTLVKFEDAAARTITLCGSDNCGGTYEAYIQPTLINNPNITVNSGLNANGSMNFTALTLQQGTFNQGDGRVTMNVYNQTGGTYNGGTYNGNTNLNTFGSFTLSGGDFNAAPTMTLTGNFTHTAAGGNFNEGSGTVFFYSTFNGTNGIVDVNTTETFNNVRFASGNGTNIAAGDTLIVNGTTTLQAGTLNTGTLDVKGNVSALIPNNGGSFQGGSANVIFSGAAEQTFSNAAGFPTFGGTWTVNKPDSVSLAENNFAPPAPTVLLVSGNIGSTTANVYVPLSIVSGNVVQTGTYSHALGSLAVGGASRFTNEFGGGLTLAGNVTNNGIISFNGGGAGCGADTIAIRSSTTGTQRSWNGPGTFLMVDTDVRDQAGTPAITVYSGTDSGNNGANWIFNGSCLQPTAAPVSVSGRIGNAQGRGIANVIVILTDAQGISRVALSNAFGNYRFNEVAAGQTVVLAPRAKKYRFDGQTQILTLSDNLAEINFTATNN